MLVTSIFSFPYNVFKSFLFQRCLKSRLCGKGLKPLPKYKTLDQSKLKHLAENKIYLAQKLNFVWGRVGNIERKGENAGGQHFLLFPTMILNGFFLWLLEVEIVW